MTKAQLIRIRDEARDIMDLCDDGRQHLETDPYASHDAFESIYDAAEAIRKLANKALKPQVAKPRSNARSKT